MRDRIPECRFFVCQKNGFNSGYINDGPFQSQKRAEKAKDCIERKTGFEQEVREEPDHPKAMYAN